MKIIHLSDLHIGKKVNGFSMLEDQKFILTNILKIINDVEAECVIIAGDIYDKPIPSAEAVLVYDEFLTSLSKMNIEVFAVSGNHDSAERIAFGARLMENSGIHTSPVYNGSIKKHVINDQYGEVGIYMIPYVKPGYVRRYFEDKNIESYSDALKVIVDEINLKETCRNIAIVHQFITGADRTESEDLTIGGLDNVDASIFELFDYVALGHIHRPQNIKKNHIRYCGTPLKYSFSEVNDKKSVTVIDFKDKGDVSISTVPLVPIHDLREIKGNYNDLVSLDYYKNMKVEDYYHITLTDEEDVPEALGKLRTIYPNIMKLDYDNKRTRTQNIITNTEKENKNPLDYLKEFYELQNNVPLNNEQISFAEKIMEKIWEN